jgi:hypothetical protein
MTIVLYVIGTLAAAFAGYGFGRLDGRRAGLIEAARIVERSFNETRKPE